MNNTVDDKKKAHKERSAGRKAVKKKAKNEHSQDLTARQRNPKAFAFQSVVKARKNFIRSEDLKSKKHHIPVVNRTPLEPPPVIVAVAGGPHVGKTTLIRCLIKHYTRQKLSTISGPVTIVAGKKKRLTFVEVNNDVNCMIDVAKIADVVLLIVDATFGISMEVFEFLEICRAHGSPRIMGVLNHLDMLKDNKALKKKKKVLKHRFQVELYPGAKLFYLSGIIHGEYLKNEISNLGRFISVMKFRPLAFRSSHPYSLIDRWEDITDEETIRKSPKCDRKVVLYGYVRGVPFQPLQWVHIAGCGDFCIKDISFLADPCPLPDQLKKRSLNAKERLLFAPMSGVSGVVYDKDAIYIDLGGSHHGRTKESGKEVAESKKTILDPLLALRKTTDERRDESEFKLFANSTTRSQLPLTESGCGGHEREDSEDDFGNEDDDDDTSLDEEHSEYEPPRKKKKETANTSKTPQKLNKFNRSEKESFILGKVTELLQKYRSKPTANSTDDSGISEDDKATSSQDEEDPEIEADPEVDSDTSENPYDFRLSMFKEASKNFLNNQSTVSYLRKFIYGDLKEYDAGDTQEAKDEEELSGDDDVVGFTRRRKNKLFDTKGNSITSRASQEGAADTCRFISPKMQDWSLAENKSSILNCFVTGEWDEKEDAEKLLKMDDEDADLYGDFEDLETGQTHSAVNEAPSTSKEQNTKEETAGNEEDKGRQKKDKSTVEKRIEKKRRLKELFDADYDDKGQGDNFESVKAEMNEQAQLNQMVFDDLDDETRVQYEGFRAGLYVRIELEKIPYEFVKNFDSSYPIVVGGLLDGEQTTALIRLRLKVHRWYPKILKNRDPLILSLGWRRFQTVVHFAKREDDFRLRSLKYARKYLYVEAVCHGPISAVSSGFVALQNLSDKVTNFRIAANGVVLGNDQSVNITKKLKLIGYPDSDSIIKKTAFIKDMFHSDTEIVKFEGSMIQTQSGIRGIVKKPKGYAGVFRATFEDVIKESDTVILKTWASVDIAKFYSCVRTLLLTAEERSAWKGMRTVAQIKTDRNIRNLPNPDNLYTEIKERRVYIPAPLAIPKALQSTLPYKNKPKVKGRAKNPKRVVVVKDPEEIKMDEFMHTLKRMMGYKIAKEKKENRLNHMKYRKQLRKNRDEREVREKRAKAKFCKSESKNKKSNKHNL